MNISSTKEVIEVFFNSFVERAFVSERRLIMLVLTYNAVKDRNMATPVHTSGKSNLSMTIKDDTNTIVTTVARRKIFLYMALSLFV